MAEFAIYVIDVDQPPGISNLVVDCSRKRRPGNCVRRYIQLTI